MKAAYLAPLTFLPLCLVLGMGLFTQWDRAASAEHLAHGWEEVARKQGAALDNLMKADADLKAATNRLQIACAAR